MSKRADLSSYELAGQVRATLSKLKRRLREQGGRDDITPSQAAVLLRLEQHGAATVSALARGEGMRPQSMSSIVATLFDAGLVNGSADPKDGRQTLFSLSKKCEKMLRDTRAARQDWLTDAIEKHLSPKEQRRLSAALATLSRLTSDSSL